MDQRTEGQAKKSKFFYIIFKLLSNTRINIEFDEIGATALFCNFPNLNEIVKKPWENFDNLPQSKTQIDHS